MRFAAKILKIISDKAEFRRVYMRRRVVGAVAE